MLVLSTCLSGACLPGSARASEATPEIPALAIGDQVLGPEAYAAWLVGARGALEVEDLIESELLWRASRAAGLAPPPRAVELRLVVEIDTLVKEGHAGQRQAWERELSAAGISVAGQGARLRRELRERMCVEALIAEQRHPSEDELRRAWERVYGPGGRQLEVRLLRILVANEVASDELRSPAERRVRLDRARAIALARAETLRTRARAGESFVELARTFGREDDETRAAGELFAFCPQDFSPELATELEKLQVAAISRPLYERGAYHIFRLEGVRLTPFESVAGDLRRGLKTRPPSVTEERALIEGLHAQCSVELDLGELARDPERARERMDATVARVRSAASSWKLTRRELGGYLIDLYGERDLERFRSAWLVARAAQARGIEIESRALSARTEAEVAHTIASDWGGSEARWLRELEARGTTRAAFECAARTRARQALRVEALLGKERARNAREVERFLDELRAKAPLRVLSGLYSR